jgi:hypothetical protein
MLHSHCFSGYGQTEALAMAGFVKEASPLVLAFASAEKNRDAACFRRYSRTALTNSKSRVPWMPMVLYSATILGS